MIERLLDKLFPHELLPFGKRWRIAGSYLSPDTDTSRSLLKRGLPWFRDCGLYLHRIDKTDDDRHCHNHPYNFGSLILRGGYCQGVLTADGVKNEWVRPLEWVPTPIERFHRVQYLPNGRAWTLFFAGKARWMRHNGRSVHYWGFNVDGKFVPWTKYREEHGHNV